MSNYFDTSAFVKIYHRETGTDKVFAIYKSNTAIFISELCKIEFVPYGYIITITTNSLSRATHRFWKRRLRNFPRYNSAN